MSAAIGALSESIVSDIIPELQMMGDIFISISTFLFEEHIYFQFLGQVISPYAILMYAIVYSGTIKNEIKKGLSYILAMPMVITIFYTDFDPDIAINFRMLLVWSAPFFLIASGTMFRTWHREINIYRKKSKLRILIVLVPAWLGIFLFNYILRAIDPHTELFRLVPLFFFIAFIFFIRYIIVTGAFGIKVQIEQ
ncbi:hypothetical protein [Paenibacillus sp. Soil522]|uniref:hypothetical protein n=1 Tax=Paenibacillus sp. Soil522 TaxID=1736388 RepID=UPI0006F64A52|nr:hypothetical protein [Paenibacillus sp. Soil522]KRE47810.1 hypothetical protein ASG81_07770 [Paenibacillus sp. Soil522]